MVVNVELCSFLRTYANAYDPSCGVALHLPEGALVRDALKMLGIPAEEAAVVMVNRVAAHLDAPLRDGDNLGGFAAISGG